MSHVLNFIRICAEGRIYIKLLSWGDVITSSQDIRFWCPLLGICWLLPNFNPIWNEIMSRIWCWNLSPLYVWILEHAQQHWFTQHWEAAAQCTQNKWDVGIAGMFSYKMEKLPESMGRFVSGKRKLSGNCRLSHAFWHSTHHYTGILNDETIFDVSPFQECLLDGSFEEGEHRSGVVPLKIENEEFNKMFVLLDSIYMNYAFFVKAVKLPASIEKTKYTQW